MAQFGAALRQTPFQPYRTPVLSALDGSTISSKAGAIEHLARQLAEPLRWCDCLDAGATAGASAALELQGTGGTLARLLHIRHPTIDSRSAADFAGVQAVLDWLTGAACRAPTP